MSKTIKARQLMTLCMSVLLVITGVVFTAPTASADEFTATVFSAPGWDYANVRVGPGLSFPVVKTIPAGSSVKLGCWVENEEVQGPYGKSKIWYKADGTDDFISDTMVDTGIDKPVTTQCGGSKPPSPGQPSGFTVKVLSGTNIKYVNARIGPTMKHVVFNTSPADATVSLICWTSGDNVENPNGGSLNRWYYTTDRLWVSGAYLSIDVNTSVVPDCNSPKASSPSPTAGVKTKPEHTRTWPIRWKINYDGNGLKVAKSLYSHYYKDDMLPGVDAEVDWSFFSNRQWLKDLGYSIPVGSLKQVDQLTSSTKDIDVYTALGGFTLYRTSEHCFLIYDWYDFDHPYETEMEDAKKGDAQEFTVYSSGCYQ